MHLLLSAAPRFLSLNVALLIVCSTSLQLQTHHYKRLLVLLVVSSLFLASSGLIGLVALSRGESTTRHIESTLSDVSQLAGQLLIAATIHPRTLADLLPRPVMAYNPQSRTTIAIITIDVIALIFKVVAQYRIQWCAYLGISLTAISTLMSSLILLRINRIVHGRRLPDRNSWQMLLAIQPLVIVASLDSLRQSDTPTTLSSRFSTALWLGGVALFLLCLPTSHFKLSSAMNEPPKYRIQRQAEYPSVSEDFRCRDPFAGPLGGSQIPMVSTKRDSEAHMELLRSSSMFLDLDLSPTAQDLRPELSRLNSKASRPTTGDTSHGGSFYTAEGHLDGELDLSASLREAGSSTKWLIPKDAADSLPSIPAPVHSPLPTNPRRQPRNRLGLAPTQLTIGLSPPAMTFEPSTRPTSHRSLHLSPLPSSWVELAEIQDRTPTQSLYLSSTSLNIAIASAADTDRIPMVAAVSAPTSVGIDAPQDNELHPQAPSMCSLPSIPSTPDTPEQTFETELSEGLVEDTLNTEMQRDSLLVGVHSPKKEDDERVLTVGAFVNYDGA